MDKKQYDFANLSNTDLQQIDSLEKTLNKDKNKEEEVILIAYKDSHHH